MRAVDLTPALLDHFLSTPLRPEDVLEWEEGLGKHPREALPGNITGAQYQRCMLDDNGVPVCVWYCNVSEGIGTLALIGADRPELAPYIHREFAHIEWAPILALAPLLQAYPSAKNTIHHKWLERFGFKKVRTLKMGRGTFLRYVRRQNTNVL